MNWKWIGIAMGTILVAILTVGQFLDKPLPTGESGAVAEQRTDLIEQFVNKEAWEKTGIVTWGFAGQQHIWDRSREMHEYQRGKRRIQHDLKTRRGRVWEDGEWRSIDAGSRLETRAWDSWVNDSFWLNPLVKLRDSGVERQAVGDNQLLVSYRSGGNTPGDSYLWTIDDVGRPTHWNLWVSIIPIGGLGCSWDGWTTLPTGALVSTIHDWGGVTLTLEDVDGGYSWTDLYDSDPFQGF